MNSIKIMFLQKFLNFITNTQTHFSISLSPHNPETLSSAFNSTPHVLIP